MIPHNQPTIGKNEIEAAASALKSGWIAQGPMVQEFEQLFCDFLGSGTGDAVAVSSGSAALYLALKVIGVGMGDEVILPTYTCSAVLNAIFLAGAKPILVDIEKQDFNPSVEAIVSVVTDNTKAIIITHTFGFPFNVIDLAKKTKIPIIEDCATALGSRIAEKSVGTMGALSTFSFYASKVISTGTGGMVYSKDKINIKHARDWRDFDGAKKYYPRFNFQMNDILGSIGQVQLDKLPSFLAARQEIAKRYKVAILKKGWKFQTASKEDYSPNNYRFVIRLSNSEERDRFQKYLADNDVKTIIPIEGWELLHNYLKMDKKNFSNAEDICSVTLSLPIFPNLLETGQIDTVVELIEDYQ